ncbi:hypothetical protein [Aquabacterium sp.]|uniref:hypothetical protein n=1 Tax=Aquabacterium sp. TaxID=1872578 RepID=UPI0035B49233
MHYLDQYVTQLGDVRGEGDIYGRLSNWQYQAFRDGSQCDALARLNEAFGFKADNPFVLQPNHLPTTAVGRLDGLVIVSANPGFRPTANKVEHCVREKSPVSNADFCRNIFDVYPKHIGTIRYWTYALRMWAMHFTAHRQHLRSRHLWSSAHDEQWEIGGIDLLPFHSSRDGITPLLFTPSGEILKRVAKQTLAMVCSMPQCADPARRMYRRVVLVSSKAGARLVNELRDEKVLQMRSQCFGPPDWKMQLLEGRAGSTVISLPYQVFSRGTPPGYSRQILAQYIGEASVLQSAPIPSNCETCGRRIKEQVTRMRCTACQVHGKTDRAGVFGAISSDCGAHFQDGVQPDTYPYPPASSP